MKKQFSAIRFTEKMVNEGLRKSLRERDASDSIEVFIQHLGEASGSDRIYIFEGSKEFTVTNTFEWCASGVTSEKANLQDVPFEVVKWWYDAFETQSYVAVKNLEDIKETVPFIYEILKAQKVRSLIAVPLILEDKIIGFWGVDNPPEDLLNCTEAMTEIVAHFLVSLLEKRSLMKQLERLSFQDPLTNVKNRHALVADMDSYDEFREVGVLFCDLVGLKKVNDRLGHLEGDKLIIRAVQCLQRVFRKSDIYRVGGDEFLVMCVGIREELFMNKVKSLKELMPEHGCMMSLGCLWEKETSDLTIMMTRADELMYEDKRAYYALHGRD